MNIFNRIFNCAELITSTILAQFLLTYLVNTVLANSKVWKLTHKWWTEVSRIHLHGEKLPWDETVVLNFHTIQSSGDGASFISEYFTKLSRGITLGVLTQSREFSSPQNQWVQFIWSVSPWNSPSNLGERYLRNDVSATRQNLTRMKKTFVYLKFS